MWKVRSPHTTNHIEVLSRPIPEASSEVTYIMLGTLATGFVQVLNFWLGSSRSSQDKSQHLADAARR